MINEKCLQKSLFPTDGFVLQIFLEWICLQSFSRLPSTCGSLPLHPTVFSSSVFPHSLRLFWNSFYHWQPLQFLAQQIPISKHLRILQVGRYIYAKMELRFSDYFVQVHWIPVHVVGQYLYRLESLLVLEQPSRDVFSLRSEHWRLFSTSKQDEWYRQIQMVFFHHSCLSRQCEQYEKIYRTAVWIAGC